MKTIAQQLGITKFPITINDSNGNMIYIEHEYGYWIRREFDPDGNVVYWENPDGDWYKCEYDENSIRIYFEHSNGYIEDNRNK